MQTVDIFGTTDTITVEKDENKTSFGFLGEVHGTFLASQSLGLGVYARYRHDDGYGRFDNVLSGNQILNGESIEIGDGSINEFSVGVRLMYAFGVQAESWW